MFNKEKYINISIENKQKYIKLIKDKFQKELSKNLNLLRVSAPLFVTPESGLQDNLTGVERRVSFDIKEDNQTLEIVQSLAKWKRYALKKYNIGLNKGIYTDMMAIRRDEHIDEIHSIYVDQWDWEKHISDDDRTLNYLYDTVNKIVNAIYKTNIYLKRHGFKHTSLSKNVFFITSEELLKMYPALNEKEREYEITKIYKTVFISQIGDKLSNSKPHDLRSPDYDDWALNGDLLFYHEVLDIALEISSMGIRVNSESLVNQLTISNDLYRLEYDYHKMIKNNELPLSIGGGIGESRLCMLLLSRAHIGEVQSTYWTKNIIENTKEKGIELL